MTNKNDKKVSFEDDFLYEIEKITALLECLNTKEALEYKSFDMALQFAGEALAKQTKELEQKLSQVKGML